MKFYSALACVLVLVGCGGEPAPTAVTTPAAETASEPGAGRDAAASAAMFRAAGERLAAKSASGDAALVPLATPLPGDVLPSFEYSRLVDMTTQVAGTMRQVGLQVRGLTPAQALESLAAAYAAKGWETTEPVEASGGNLAQSFFKGGEGSAMAVVVASGGTYITVVTSVYDEAGAAHSGGFTGSLNIVINAQ